MIRSFYGLTQNPFAHDSRTLELLPFQQEIHDTLKVHCQQGGLCLVLGVPGTGKSVIKQSLQRLPASNLTQMHMLLGFLTVGALWVVGIGQAFFAGGSWSVALYAVAVGALTIVVGMMHASVMVGQFHWIIQVIHLLLGIVTIGLGHMAAARHRKVER